ncbi:MAG TPA: cation transporter [Poseidonia sp.]|nr:cation transporter [Poseidonia sp.]
MEEITHLLSITGMTCSSCSQRVTNVLNNVPGVISAEISHEKNSGTIVASDTITVEEIVAIVQSTGFAVKA